MRTYVTKTPAFAGVFVFTLEPLGRRHFNFVQCRRNYERVITMRGAPPSFEGRTCIASFVECATDATGRNSITLIGLASPVVVLRPRGVIVSTASPFVALAKEGISTTSTFDSSGICTVSSATALCLRARSEEPACPERTCGELVEPVEGANASVFAVPAVPALPKTLRGR